MPTFERSKKGYGNLWNEARVTHTGEMQVSRFVKMAMINRNRYEVIQRKTGCPWYVVAAIHMCEFSMRFTGHLHNGDPLSKRTTHVPKGRPKTSEPPFTWEESALDALSVAPHDMSRVGRWSVERTLYELEKYNGFGYLGKINSPYLWAGTTLYHKGKYVADGRYDANYVSTQSGCVTFLKELAMRDTSVAARLQEREAEPPEDVIKEEKKRASKTGQVIAGSGTMLGGGTAGTQISSEPIMLKYQPAILIGIGLGLALLTVGVVLWMKGVIGARKSITARW